MQVQNILQYASLFTITDDLHIPTKKYVDDAISAISPGGSFDPAVVGAGLTWDPVNQKINLGGSINGNPVVFSDPNVLSGNSFRLDSSNFFMLAEESNMVKELYSSLRGSITTLDHSLQDLAEIVIRTRGISNFLDNKESNITLTPLTLSFGNGKGSFFIGEVTSQIENNNIRFQDNRLGADKKGIQLTGFGETNINMPGFVNYSTLVFNSLVPKKYVDDALGSLNGATLTYNSSSKRYDVYLKNGGGLIFDDGLTIGGELFTARSLNVQNHNFEFQASNIGAQFSNNGIELRGNNGSNEASIQFSRNNGEQEVIISATGNYQFMMRSNEGIRILSPSIPPTTEEPPCILTMENNFLTGRRYMSVANSLKFSNQITGNGTDTSFTITHNKDTRDVIVQVYDNTTYEQVLVSTTRPTVNTVNVIFATAPANGVTYRVVII